MVGKMLGTGYFPRLLRVGKNFMHNSPFCGLAYPLNKSSANRGFAIHLNKPVFDGRAACIDDQNIHVVYLPPYL
jgi:hypothetical protein